MVKACEGECPKCGSLMILYGALEVQDGGVYYPFNCPKCGASGREWHELVYVETITND
jgi:DNA-directed RNA polymerase subunit M/transcription elongation factor TFIIS